MPAYQFHHDSSLPTQRYATRDSLTPTRNPIVPEDMSKVPLPGFDPPTPASFFEVHSAPQRPRAVGNPIFGYSTHPIPPALEAEVRVAGGTGPAPAPAPVASGAAAPMQQSKISSHASSRSRMEELQQAIEDERNKRKQIEAQLLSTG